MALLLPLLGEHQRLMSSVLGSGDNLLLVGDTDDLLRRKLSGDDFLPLLPRRIRRQASHPFNKSLSVSKSNRENKNFIVNIDVQQFAPDEITVKGVNDDTIVVECKHEEKPDDHGSIYRHFLRKYKVPKGHEVSKSSSKLSSDGVLSITVPKIEKRGNTEIEIPITFTNQPSAIQVQQSSSEKSEKMEVEQNSTSPRKESKT